MPACTGQGVYASMHWAGGVYPMGRGDVCPGGCLPRGMSAQGCLPGGPAQGGVCPRDVWPGGVSAQGVSATHTPVL